MYLSRNVADKEGSDGAGALPLELHTSRGLSAAADINSEVVNLTMNVLEKHRRCISLEAVFKVFYPKRSRKRRHGPQLRGDQHRQTF